MYNKRPREGAGARPTLSAFRTARWGIGLQRAFGQEYFGVANETGPKQGRQQAEDSPECPQRKLAMVYAQRLAIPGQRRQGSRQEEEIPPSDQRGVYRKSNLSWCCTCLEEVRRACDVLHICEELGRLLYARWVFCDFGWPSCTMISRPGLSTWRPGDCRLNIGSS